MYNNALRWRYVTKIQRNPVLPGKDRKWTKGIEPGIAQKLQDDGVGTVVFLITSVRGTEYVQECRDAGVPVPRAMFSAEWDMDRQGKVIENVFIDRGSQAELWSFTSTTPPGVCLALPRYRLGTGGAGNEASPLGIICLNTQNNKACFFDSPNGRSFTRNVRVDIGEFLGGVDLVTNGQGTCTDCHAGENPFVVHPDQPAFRGLALSPSGWYIPSVDATWPQNPGPTNLLDAIGSPGQCNGCHVAGGPGRFPEVSTQLPMYCNAILRSAAGRLPPPPPPRPINTMPPHPPGSSTALYTAHIDELIRACSAPSSSSVGVVVQVSYPDDRDFLSPPIVEPLYDCATKVAVRGARLTARVDVYVNGGRRAGTDRARNPDRLEFDVPLLRPNDVVTATQEYNGVPSGLSPEARVRDHRLDFPGGRLPPPVINPTLIYACAETIAVNHVPTAVITVETDGGTAGHDSVSVATSTGWTTVVPNLRPFQVGYSFTATARICEDVSPPSRPERAIVPPVTLSLPSLSPPNVYAGQELVTVENLTNGSRGSISEASFGPVGEFTTPVSTFPNFDVATSMGRPLSAGDRLVVSQRLCPGGTAVAVAQILPVAQCAELPAPRIRVPLVGDNYVVVSQSVPGARIRVYDAGSTKLGDGSGTVILLRRALTGADTVTVVQGLGDCNSLTGFRVSVHNPL